MTHRGRFQTLTFCDSAWFCDGAVQGLLNLSFPFPRPLSISLHPLGLSCRWDPIGLASRLIMSQRTSPSTPLRTCGSSPASLQPRRHFKICLPSCLSQTLSTSPHLCSSYHTLTYSLLQSHEEIWPI